MGRYPPARHSVTTIYCFAHLPQAVPRGSLNAPRMTNITISAWDVHDSGSVNNMRTRLFGGPHDPGNGRTLPHTINNAAVHQLRVSWTQIWLKTHTFAVYA